MKQTAPILVILGNPPYNGFAGVSPEEEGELVEPYKRGLAEEWGITKNYLDDLYIRFYRVAERRIGENARGGIVSLITNFSWLGDPSAVVMRKRFLSEFDLIQIDCLNGDSRETGKQTPDGQADPSVFSTPMSASGIQVGTAISMLVRTPGHGERDSEVSYRDHWGSEKRDALRAEASEGATAGPTWLYNLRPTTAMSSV